MRERFTIQLKYSLLTNKKFDHVKKSKDEIILTKLGKETAFSTRNKRHSILIKEIFSRKVFYDTYNKIEEKKFDKNIVIDIMKKNRGLTGSTDNMLNRRSQTIIAWCKWIKNIAKQID